MFRTFGLQTLTGNAQPIFGDVLTAAMVPPPSNREALVNVASTTYYQIGDRILIDVGQTNQDIVIIDRVFSATQLYCRSEGSKDLQAHAVGALLALSLAAADLLVQTVTGNVYLGTDKTITNAGAGSALALVTPTIPFQRPTNGAYNTIRTTDLWMAGTAAGGVLVSATVI